jgi:hypothetical protein
VWDLTRIDREIYHVSSRTRGNRSVNIGVNPEWTDEELKNKIDVINATIQAL